MDIEYKHYISVDDYNKLRKSVGWNKVEERQALIGLENSSFLIVAISNNKAIGLIRVISDGGYIAMIVDLIVAPEYQGRGIGKYMMQESLKYIRSNLKEGQSVLVNLMATKGHESFYEQFNFLVRPNALSGAGMTKWIHA